MKAANGRSLDIRVYWRVCMLNMASLVHSRTAQFALQSPEFDAQQRSLDNNHHENNYTAKAAYASATILHYYMGAAAVRASSCRASG
jgi:hypothetical protein